MNNPDYLSENNVNQAQSSFSRKTSMMKYLQNPFSVTWSKLATLTRSDNLAEEKIDCFTQSNEESDTDKLLDTSDINEYVHLTDWVEPSVYFTIFCPQRYNR